jgi:5'-nucleotidase
MRILLSNDDGFLSPGIAALYNAIKEIATVQVVAPDRDRSGASNSLTLDRPLKVIEADNGFFHVNGTPTDCVHLAVTGLIDTLPDMVISGINHGANAGDDILYSGTVAAATEGRALGLPSFAISLAGKALIHFESAAKVAANLALQLKHTSLPASTILNVNVPDIPFDQIKGYMTTRLGTRHVSRPSIKDVDPRHNEIYWIGLPGKAADSGEGTDFYAINNGYVSITPIKVDLTHYESMEAITNWIEKF